MTLDELERRIGKIRPLRLVVLCRSGDGVEHEMSASESVASGYDFIRVMRGNDLQDVDLLLHAFKAAIM